MLDETEEISGKFGTNGFGSVPDRESVEIHQYLRNSENRLSRSSLKYDLNWTERDTTVDGT